MAEFPFLLFDADNHYRRVMRDNALALAQRRPVAAA